MELIEGKVLSVVRLIEERTPPVCYGSYFVLIPVIKITLRAGGDLFEIYMYTL